tara:strand:+ start:1262 stop:1423 length:162 start_codon:yes stop_codon:yes gene_type:complete
MNQLLQAIQHPIEGIAYLVYIGIFVRWKFPQKWNQFIESLLVKNPPSKSKILD